MSRIAVLFWSGPSHMKKRNNEMAESYPDEAEFLIAFNERVIDLMNLLLRTWLEIRHSWAVPLSRKFFLQWY